MDDLIKKARGFLPRLREAYELAISCRVLAGLPQVLEQLTDALEAERMLRDAAVKRAEQVERERDEAREWVRKMVRETQTLTCVYCGHAYPPGTPAHGSDVLTAHIESCDKHPARAIREERDRLRACLAECKKVIEAVRKMQAARKRATDDAGKDRHLDAIIAVSKIALPKEPK